MCEPTHLVIGDVMLDKYIWGEVRRISPEAPVPVVHVSHESQQPGGAANVAMNLAHLGVQNHTNWFHRRATTMKDCWPNVCVPMAFHLSLWFRSAIPPLPSCASSADASRCRLDSERIGPPGCRRLRATDRLYPRSSGRMRRCGALRLREGSACSRCLPGNDSGGAHAGYTRPRRPHVRGFDPVPRGHNDLL